MAVSPWRFHPCNGAELRRPLGIAIVGGLIVSQMLTLFTTPVVYLYMDRLRAWVSGGKKLEQLRGVPPVAHTADSAVSRLGPCCNRYNCGLYRGKRCQLCDNIAARNVGAS